MIKKILIKKNTYRDSLFLMVINAQARILSGIEEIAVMMGTDSNKDVMKQVGFSGREIDSATANDMLICVKGQDEGVLEKAFAQIEDMLTRKPSPAELEDVYKTLESVMRERPETNFAIISVPGQFAAREARKALMHGLNVLLFSDNVSLKDEIELKELASKLNRIVMGPDCGTAIINHVPLAFANFVKPGPIGSVAAAGTGLQEVACLIDRQGQGISQAIGTGGRDLYGDVGARSMLKGIDILEEDGATEVIVLISKPPAPSSMSKVLDRVSKSGKKFVINFLGCEFDVISGSGAIPARTLEEAAFLAVATLKGEPYEHRVFTIPQAELGKRLQEETEKMSPEQRFIRGLYSGGTLCYEAMMIIGDSVKEVYSNVASDPDFLLVDPAGTKKHSFIDFGDDYFTKGRPHPMMSPDTRSDYIKRQGEDPEVAVVLLDIVLGYGSHTDMAGALSGSIAAGKSKAEKNGGHLAVVASVCGTARDLQGFSSQVSKLEEVGVVVMPSNAQAARFAATISIQRGKGIWDVKEEQTRREVDMEIEKDREESKKTESFFEKELVVVNIGVKPFYDDLKRSNVRVSHVDWQPPAGGDDEMTGLLDKLL